MYLCKFIGIVENKLFYNKKNYKTIYFQIVRLSPNRHYCKIYYTNMNISAENRIQWRGCKPNALYRDSRPILYSTPRKIDVTG